MSLHLANQPIDALAAFSLSRVASGALDLTTWRLVWANQALHAILGDAEDGAEDLAIEELLAPEVTVRQLASLAAVASGKLAGVASDTTLLRRDGSRFGAHLSVGLIGDAASPVMFLQVVPDSAPAEHLIASAEVRRRLEAAIEAMKNDTRTRGVLLLATIDRIEEIDEIHGYDVGDQLVMEIERRLRGVVRAGDTVLRTGRNEIGLVVGDVPSSEHADTVAARLARMACYPIYTDAGVHEVRLTIGQLLLDSGATEGSSALRQACRALNRARRVAPDHLESQSIASVA